MKVITTEKKFIEVSDMLKNIRKLQRTTKGKRAVVNAVITKWGI